MLFYDAKSLEWVKIVHLEDMVTESGMGKIKIWPLPFCSYIEQFWFDFLCSICVLFHSWWGRPSSKRTFIENRPLSTVNKLVNKKDTKNCLKLTLIWYTSCGGRTLSMVNKLVEYSSNEWEIDLHACTTGPATHQSKQKCPRPSGSRAMAVETLATFSAARLAWSRPYLPGATSGFCRIPLALPELPTPSTLSLGPVVTGLKAHSPPSSKP